MIDCLRAEAENPNAFFLIVGDGTEFPKLERFFEEECPTNMKLMKALPKDDYDRMIAACDVGMIFLDHRFTIPNFPSRLLSYMQAALPVLACTDPHTDIGQMIEEGGFGWWCESNDVERFHALAETITAQDRTAKAACAKTYLREHYSAHDACQIIERAMTETV